MPTLSLSIYNLPPKNSSGCDGISSKQLKVIAPVIIKSLTLLINQVLDTGTFPDKLKIAKVIPIYKKGDPSLFENYRPVSLFPAISKVLEKIIALQLSSYFEKNILLFDVVDVVVVVCFYDLKFFYQQPVEARIMCLV